MNFKRLFFILRFYILAILIGLLAWSYEIAYKQILGTDDSKGFNAEVVQNVLHRKQSITGQLLSRMEKLQVAETTSLYLQFDSIYNASIFQNEGIVLLTYRNDSLIWWSDNYVPVNKNYSKLPLDTKIVKLNNGIYLAESLTVDNSIYIGLILIKHNYSFENEYLENKFHRDFEISKNVRLSLNSGESIKDISNEYVFSLVPSKFQLQSDTQSWLSTILYFLGLILLFFAVYRHFYFYAKKRPSPIWALLLFSSIIILRFIMLEFKIPVNIYELEFFRPELFGYSFWFFSLGDFLINSILIFTVAYFFSRTNSNEYLTKIVSKQKKLNTYLIVLLVFIFLELYFWAIYDLFRSLIGSSSIPFEVYKTLDLNFYTFIGFTILGILYAAFMLMLEKFIALFCKIIKIKEFVIIFLIAMPFLFIFPSPTQYTSEVYFYAAFILLVGIITFLKFRSLNYEYYTYILIVFIISEFTVLFVLDVVDDKERGVRVFLAENAPADRDIIAERLIEDFEKIVSKDKSLLDSLSRPRINEENIRKYLNRKYFYKYLARKYNVHVNVCRFTDSILIEGDAKKKNCLEHYDEIINSTDEFIAETGFHFLNNTNGIISYLGRLEFFIENEFDKISLFIELQMKIGSEEIGYPELLLDKSSKRRASLFSKYAYVKYKGNEKIISSGDYPYSLKRSAYNYTDTTYAFFSSGGYDHLIFNQEKETTIIIGKPLLQPFDIVISLSYIFVVFFILLNIALIINRSPKLIRSFDFNFRFKIQFSLVSILSLSSIIIGGGTLYYNINQFEKRQMTIINDKLLSITHGLKDLVPEENLSNNHWNNTSRAMLEEQLNRLMNIFFVDIHAYDTDGNLIASSRSEIFEHGLMGQKMNAKAYKALEFENKARFVHNEIIGNLEYLSGYVPLKNEHNKTIAYINLPYFSDKDIFGDEIPAFAVAMISVYALLILLAVVIAIFISNKISHPLSLIQSKFREVELGKKNAQIFYNKEDEIGQLIKEYNRMVVELANSAELLAKSEREGAWREMAKQIAHEIKNPLTPMKLNVQLLLRSWNDNDPRFGLRVEKIAKILIEQIDRLSSIATAFSNFAKMPTANNEIINILEVLESTVQLYENTDNVKISFDIYDEKDPYVWADKKQMSQVFINLVKNAIQAIPDTVNGTVELGIFANESSVTVRVTDNGSGIPENVRDKLFRPNFTTKSSGMGMGLSIVKSIVENSSGKIWFITEMDKGTSFFVELPLRNSRF